MFLKKCLTLASLIFLFILFSISAAYGQSEDPTNYNPNSPQITNQVRLAVDGVETGPETMPFQLNSGRTVISLPALQRLVPFQSESGISGEVVIIWEDKRIQLFPETNQILVNSLPQTLDIAPFTADDGSLMLPLRSICEVLGYQVIYDEINRIILLNSPGYQPLPPTAAVSQIPVSFDFTKLPTWGNVWSIPGLANLWQESGLITGYFTRLVNSPAGRTNNVILSSAKVNGTILQPGDTFSFNKTVGPRTAQIGYHNAKIFAGKKVVTGIGGGVCQTSSTIYNLALDAGMQILERYPHSLKVVYTAPNRDATVTWGGADLKFRNNKNYPVKILCKVDNGYVFAVMVKPELSNPVVPAAGQ